ncbi:MAG: signal peptidase I [Clostridia bacterium]|nr:signal peptidase I [Clostridia bacterium]
MQTEKSKDSWVAKQWAAHKVRAAKAKEKEKNKPLKQKILEWIFWLLMAFVIAFLIRGFVMEPIRVDGYSMTNTLQDKEIVLLYKLPYLLGDVQRNDIVVCRYPGRVNENGATQINFGATLSLDVYTAFVKRVVGLPGDTIQISDGHLFVNGEQVPDPEYMASTPRDYGPITLGDDEYFVMGDNRFSSHDSRSSDVGPLSRSAIMGKVTRVLLPLSAWRSVK